LRPRVEGQTIDGADLSLRARGSNTLASSPVGTIAYFAARDRRILLIHGYNVDESEGQNSMAQLRSALIEGCSALERQILTVTWPGNASWLKGGSATYSRKVPVAAKAGRLLCQAILSEAEWGLGTRQLVVVAHSLGCRLTLEFLSHLSRAFRPPGLEKVVVILMAAAVPIHLTPLLDAARSNADEIIVLHSTDDKVLRKWFKIGEPLTPEKRYVEAVGFAGNPHVPPWSYHRRMMGYDHDSYWTGAATADVIGERLSASFTDIVYRPAALRTSTLAERSLLDEAGYLPQYSLPLF
jgi:pimeloyl-ACP methyl ester carboxylesterase